MKQLLIVIALNVFAFQGIAQTLSQQMTQYINGCDMLLMGIKSKNLADISEAANILTANHLKLLQFEDFEYLDSLESGKIGSPLMMFTPDFANEIAKSDEILDIYEISEPYIMRKGDEYDLQLWNASIAPNSSVTFKATGVDQCEILLYSPISTPLSLSVTVSNNVIDIHQTTTSVSVSSTASWVMHTIGQYFFTISNTSNSVATFVIAVN